MTFQRRAEGLPITHRLRRGPRLGLAMVATLIGVVTLFAGCSSTEFYMQSITGQWDLMRRAKPIDEVVRETDDAGLKARLEKARAVRTYASSELGLPANATFTRYADLGRPYVVWNVFVTPELSLEPRRWCFPVAGCVNYRGYFAEAEARVEANRFAAVGDDVHVSGVSAYSTLGWFDDPILSSFVRYPDTDFVRMIFHELAHQVVYVKDDTAFNESFAVAVEDEGVRRWLATLPAGPERARLEAELARSDWLRAEFRRLVVATREQLIALYASNVSDEAKRQGKAEIFATMRVAYSAAKAGDPGLAGFDRWFAGWRNAGPNNASLAAVALYTDRVRAFRALLAQENGDLPAFYVRVKELAAKPKAERDAALAALEATATAAIKR